MRVPGPVLFFVVIKMLAVVVIQAPYKEIGGAEDLTVIDMQTVT